MNHHQTLSLNSNRSVDDIESKCVQDELDR